MHQKIVSFFIRFAHLPKSFARSVCLKRIPYKYLFAICFFSLTAFVAKADDKVKKILDGKDFSLEVLGEVKTYHLKEKEKTTIIAVDGIVLKVDNMVTTAKRVAWVPHTQDLYLEGSIEVRVNESVFYSEQMTYNLKTKKGYIVSPTAILKAPERLQDPSSEETEVIEIEKGRFLFITAKSATITKEEFLLTELSITTNGYLTPFYKINASTAVYENDKSLQSWNNTIRVGNIPIFYFPYLLKDLQHNWPWVKIRLDQSSRYGLNGELQVKTFFNDNAIIASWKPMELRGHLFALEYERKKEGEFIFIKAEGIKERWKPESKLAIHNLIDPDDKIKNSTITKEDRYRAHAIVKKDLMWNFSFDLEIDKVDSTKTYVWKQDSEYARGSSAHESPFSAGYSELKKSSYRRDYYRDEFYEYKSPESMGQLKWIKGPYAARLIYKKNINEFKYDEERNNNEELEIKPGFLFDINSAKIADFILPLYFDSHIRLESLSKEITNADQSVTKFDSERFFTQSLLQTKYSLFDRIHLNAWAGVHETGYSDIDVQPRFSKGSNGIFGNDTIDFEVKSNTKNNMNRFAFLYGGGFNFTLNKYFGLNSNFLGLNGMIHRITPSIEFFGSSTPNKDTIDLPQFDEFDEFQKDNRLKIELKQQFINAETFGDWIVWRTWSYIYFDRPEISDQLQNLANEFQFNITQHLTIRNYSQLERGQGLTKSLNQLSFKNDNLTLRLTERWEKDYPWQTDLDANLKIGSRYRIFGGGTYINKKAPDGMRDTKGIIDYHFGITRRVHEFSMSLEFRHDRLYDEKSISFHFRLF